MGPRSIDSCLTKRHFYIGRVSVLKLRSVLALKVEISSSHDLNYIIIKFGYNARCNWLKERAL